MACLLFVGTGCKYFWQEKFDKTEWRKVVDGFPPDCRRYMLDDLTSHHKLVGLKYSDLISLLGRPDYTDDFREDTTIAYDIIVDYGFDIDPVYTKTLQFQFSKDSVVTGFHIVESKK